MSSEKRKKEVIGRLRVLEATVRTLAFSEWGSHHKDIVGCLSLFLMPKFFLFFLKLRLYSS